ncbi:MAG TPA: HXXEE domain-containing protein [Candidatus Acidoferrales bacterium]|nr:HXXEE domain-containing protein [Candidatus Acidoferrales bacterium]
MEDPITDLSFGIAWIVFALALALHVADEARHDFLSTYNPSVRAIRAKLPFLPIPTFTFRIWLSLLIAGIVLLLCLSPLAFSGNHALRLAARVLAIVVGIFNAVAHLASSAYLRRWLPGVYSSPVLLAAAIYLLTAL